MAKENHVSIRRNTTGSYKMRMSFYCGKKEMLKRVQLGLMTDELPLAITRTKVVWNAIRLMGYTSFDKAVCSYKDEESKETCREVWEGTEIFYKRDVVKSGKQEYKSRLIREFAQDQMSIFLDGTGAYSMSVSFIYFKSNLLIGKDIPMVTLNRYEASERGFIVYRSLQHILTNSPIDCRCVHGNLFREAVKSI